MICVKNMLQRYLLHCSFRFLLYPIKIALQCVLNMDADAAVRVGVCIQMKKPLLSLYGPVDIQQ